MIAQAASLHRCGSCERWGGLREAAPDTCSVLLESDQASGLCGGGPWDGSERRARSACGRWVLWASLAPGADTKGESLCEAGPHAAGLPPV